MAILSFLHDDAFIFFSTLATQQRLEVKSDQGFVANIILDWTVTFSLIVQRFHFVCRKFSLLAIDGACREAHLLRTTLRSLVAVLLSECTVTH